MINLRIHSNDVWSPSSEPLEPPTRSAPLAAREAPWVRTLEHLANRIPYEATRTEMLVGMGCGAVLSQVGSLLGLRGLLAAGLRGEAAIWLGRAAGLVTETTGFMAASRGVAQALGQPVEQDWHALGKEWLSMFCFLGMTRLGLSGVRQIYGADWAPKTRWQSLHFGLAQQGAALAATLGTGAAEWRLGLRNFPDSKGFLADSLAQLATFQMAGSLVHHTLGQHLMPLERSLEAEARLLKQPAAASNLTALHLAFGGLPGNQPPVDPMLHVLNKGDGGGGKKDNAGFWALDSAKAQPQEGAHVVPVIGLGEIVRRLGSSEVLDALGKKDVRFELSDSLSSSSGPEQLLNRVVQELNEQTNKGKNVGGRPAIILGRKVFLQLDPKIYPNYLEPLEIILGKDGFSPGSVGPVTPRSAVAARGQREGAEGDAFSDTLRMDLRRLNPNYSVPEASLLNISDAGEDHKMGSFLELKRKVENNAEEALKLREDLERNDRAFVFRQALGFRPEWALKLLNELPGLAEIDDGRTVTFTWPMPTGTKTVVLEKKGESFIESTRESSRSPAPSRGRRAAAPAVTLDPENEPASGVNNLASCTWDRQHIPALFEDLQHLPLLLRHAAQSAYPGKHPTLILEGQTAHAANLRQTTEGNVPGLPDGTHWELWVPKNAKSSRVFLASVKNGEVSWQHGDAGEWEQAERQVHFANRVVADPAEIFLHLEALSRNKGALPGKIVFKHRGTATFPYVEGLGPYIEQILTYHPVATNYLIVVEKQSGKDLLIFSRTGERWKYTVGKTVPPPG